MPVLFWQAIIICAAVAAASTFDALVPIGGVAGERCKMQTIDGYGTDEMNKRGWAEGDLLWRKTHTHRASDQWSVACGCGGGDGGCGGLVDCFVSGKIAEADKLNKHTEKLLEFSSFSHASSSLSLSVINISQVGETRFAVLCRLCVCVCRSTAQSLRVRLPGPNWSN